MGGALGNCAQCVKTHSGHLLGENIYGSYPTVRVLSEDMKKKILQMESVGASRRRIADSVGEETGNLTFNGSSSVN